MAYSHILMGGETLHAEPVVRRIGLADLKYALARGIDDFKEMPSHGLFLCLIYPIIGIVVGWLTFGYGLTPLLYPLVAGFALLGPVAAIGLYELSRQRERGVAVDVTSALHDFRLPSYSAIVALGGLLMVIFLVWLAVAQAIYIANFGYASPPPLGQFVHHVFTTPAGWMLIVVGNGVGFLFALVVLAISVVSFPLLLDRDVGAVEAVLTSVRAVRKNPLTMAVWGLMVAAALVLGSLPFLLGLAVVLPVLGHATWHLYRRVVVPDVNQRDELPPPPKRQHHYAAQFPAALFAGEEPRENE